MSSLAFVIRTNADCVEERYRGYRAPIFLVRVKELLQDAARLLLGS